ncbi:MAG TPA: ABC transporter permease [Ktedonobacteraceae bacterium]|nr:ABC transporter permease [Ktedonobacteraceae bacterium]
MTQHVPVAQQDDWASIAIPDKGKQFPQEHEGFIRSIISFVEKTFTIVGLEARKIRHDPTDIFTRAVQPALWLLVFGEVLSRLRAIPTGGRPYMDFLAPGILAQSVLFIAIFSGIAIIWERDLGIVHKFLASPTPRAALVLGKAFSAGVRGLTQAAIVYLLAWILGVDVSWNPLNLLGVIAIVILGAACFSTFSLIIACLVKTRERFMGIGQVLTMPLFFASNAIYPIVLMPAWLQVIARCNPLTYEVDALRYLMLNNGISAFGIGTDFAVLTIVTAALVLLGARLYPRVAY